MLSSAVLMLWIAVNVVVVADVILAVCQSALAVDASNTPDKHTSAAVRFIVRPTSRSDLICRGSSLLR